MEVKLICEGLLISLAAAGSAIGAEPQDSTSGGVTISGSAAYVLPTADPVIDAAGIAAPKLDADPKTFDRANVIRGFVAEVEKNHITHRPLDDRQAARWFDHFLDDLDPQRMYFLHADYVQIQQFRGRLLDLARRGDTQFPDQVRRQYAKRVKEACSIAAVILSTRHDFSVDEDFPRRYSAYASDGDGLRERWRLRIKAELLVEKIHGTKPSDAKAWLLDRSRRIARQAGEMTDERLCEIYLNALGQVRDPHTAWISPRETAALTENMNLGHYTTGLQFQQHDGRYLITNVRPTLAGKEMPERLVGWELLAIQRLDGTTFDVVEMPLYDFMQLTRSPFWALDNDTDVILELSNPVSFERRTVSWVRLFQR